MEDKYEKLGQLIDELDNYACGLNLPLGDKVHVEQLKLALPELTEKMKAVFEQISGENPWKYS